MPRSFLLSIPLFNLSIAISLYNAKTYSGAGNILALAFFVLAVNSLLLAINFRLPVVMKEDEYEYMGKLLKKFRNKYK